MGVRMYICTSLHSLPLPVPTNSHRGFGKGVGGVWVGTGALKEGDCYHGKGLGNHLIQTLKILAKQPPQAPTIGF